MRKSLKAFTILFAAVISVASLAGCNGSDNNTSSQASTVSSAPVSSGNGVSIPFFFTSDDTQASVQDNTGTTEVQSGTQVVDSTPAAESSIQKASVQKSSSNTGSITMREYIDQNGGQAALDSIASTMSSSQMTAKIYFSGDDLVYDMTSNKALMANIPEDQREAVKKTMYDAMKNYLDQNKSNLMNQLEQTKAQYNIKDFNIQFIVRDNDGTVLFNEKV